MSSAKPPISLATAVIAVLLMAALGFAMGLSGVPQAVAIAVTALIVAAAVVVLVPRWLRRR